MGENKLTDQNVSDIDKALAAAKARKAAKDGTPAGEKPNKPAKEPSAPAEPKRPRLTDEEKAAKIEARNQERATRKSARETARAEKIAERTAARQPAHMRKVQKAAEKLPSLSDASQLLFSEITASHTAAELSALASHILHFNRVSATSRALSQKLEVGQTVTIIGGDSRFVGKTGTVSKVQRIRCYVSFDGVKKDAYFYTSDVSGVEAVASEESEVASA